MSDRLPATEAERLAAVHALGLLDTPAEARFDRITSLASRLLGMPISLIALVDRDRHWNKSKVGVTQQEWPLSASICRHVVQDDAPLVVNDLREDARFADNPFVVDGARFYAGWPLHDGLGVPLGTLCVLDDEPRELAPEQHEVMRSLADWAQAELNATMLAQALQDQLEAEKNLVRLLDQAPAAVLLVEQGGTVDWVNAPSRRLFGASSVGAPIDVLLPGIALRDLEGQGRRTTDVDVPAGRRFVQRGRRSDGSSFPAELTVSVSGRRRSRYIVFVRDLSVDASGEAELALLRQRTEVAFDALAEGVLVVEADGRLSFGNLVAAQMVQRRRSDLAGAVWHDLLHQVPADVEPCELVDVLALAGRTLSPVELRRADGTSLPVELTVRLLQTSDAAAGVVVTMHDLRERLRTERLKTELVSAVSHELRTPLTSIRGSLSLLRAKVIDPASEQGARMIDIATTSTERLSRLVNDILDLERLQAGRVELQLSRQRAAGLLVAAAQAVSGAAVEAGVRVDVLDSDEWVIADTDRAVQILVNLLGNAAKFSPSGSTVTLSVRREGDRVLLSVADQGRGIPADELDRIFDRFAQVDGSDSREHEGTGLGLAIAKGLAEQHGGTLSATSTVGEGSTFTLSLPVATTRRRLLAYAPAERVPGELAQLLAERGWEAVATTAAGLARVRAGALMVAPGDEDEVAAVGAQAAALRLPLLTLTTAAEGEAVLAATATAAAVASPASAQGHVLVVEDDDDLAEVLCASLTRHGVDVVRAHTQEAAVAAVLQHSPDVLVLDVRLAGGDGFGVVDELRDRGLGAEAPILVYSVLELDAADRERLQTGGTSFLTKGRDRVEDVVSDVVRLLEGSRPAAASPRMDA